MWEQGSYVYSDGQNNMTFTYEAKVYDNPSRHGINAGRVSKLVIFDPHGDYAVEFDRGWIIKPKPKTIEKKVMEEILKKYI